MVLNRLHILNVFQGIALILHFTHTEGRKTLQRAHPGSKPYLNMLCFPVVGEQKDPSNEKFHLMKNYTFLFFNRLH